jgi:hypothetical protein
MLKRRLRNVSESHRDARQRLLNPRYRDFTYVLKWHYTYLKNWLSVGKGRQTHRVPPQPKRGPSEARATQVLLLMPDART